jgi:hypothetical protein
MLIWENGGLQTCSQRKNLRAMKKNLADSVSLQNIYILVPNKYNIKRASICNPIESSDNAAFLMVRLYLYEFDPWRRLKKHTWKLIPKLIFMFK